jgi:glycopeptide antibiotics resistance protein
MHPSEAASDSSAARSRPTLGAARAAAESWPCDRWLVRLVAAIGLLIWLGIGLVLTLQPAHPLPGQVVTDNLVPFRTIRIYLANATDPFWIRQAIGNVLLLLPIGLLGPVVSRALDRWWRVLLLALAISTAIEVAQLWIPDRSADVDDVMLNVIGAVLGFAVRRITRLVFRPSLA